MRWADEFEFCERPDCPKREQVSRDRFFILQFLRGLDRNTNKLSEMRLLLMRHHPGTSVSRMSDANVFGCIADMLFHGRLHIHNRLVHRVSTSGTPAQTSVSEGAGEVSAPFPLSESRRHLPTYS